MSSRWNLWTDSTMRVSMTLMAFSMLMSKVMFIHPSIITKAERIPSTAFHPTIAKAMVSTVHPTVYPTV